MFQALHEQYRPYCSREELKDSMTQYYSPEDEKKYGVIGIHIQPFSPQEEMIRTYHDNINEYIDNTISTPSPILIARIEKSLKELPLTSKILEV